MTFACVSSRLTGCIDIIASECRGQHNETEQNHHRVAGMAGAAGIVIGRMNLPLVHKGDALFHIASFNDSVAVSESLEEFKEEIIEERLSDSDIR